DICVGVPVANRSESAISGLIGFFVNTIALRSMITASDSFMTVLSNVKQTVIDGYNYQDIPFEKIVDRVVKVRDQSRSPLIQTLFSLQSNNQGSDLRLGDTKIDFEEVATETSKFDLLLDVVDITEELQVSFEYCTALFKEETIIRMAGHFKKLIASVLTDATQLVGKLSLITADEEQQLKEFNPAPKEPTKGTIVDLFTQQVEKTPEAIAVVYHNDQLTYKELNRRSDTIAWNLQELGVGKGDLVPICLNRSVDTVPAILGVLKSGAGYIPVDAKLPEDRIKFILEDIDSPVLITKTNEINKEIIARYIQIFNIDEIDERNTVPTGKSLIPIIGNDHLAYIIYTSGTTGKPKGVKIRHKSLMDRSISYKEDYGVNENTRLLQLANFSFDVFVADLCKSILFGGQLILCDPEDSEPESICGLIEKFGITIIESTPGIILPVTSQILKKNLLVPTLRTLIIGSDSWNLEDYKKLVHSFKDRIGIINSYGTTETTIDATIFKENDAKKLEQYLTLPIGKAIRNTSMYVLNDYLNLVPIGIAGELCIGGIGVGEGYLNRDVLTSEKFIANPYG
ncbi:non-ribosomal peptide synthetase, partial [Ascidiimonas sp. W6]|uniref:non-ribosomal peptide synthetase n=1 Tax=Ascidiimonas meishanensis TaxID=3128903 RepID=UPI0030ECF52E